MKNRAATSSAPHKPTPAEVAGAAGKGIRDVVGPDLRVLFVGINPGLYTPPTAHPSARPGNRFWPALHAAGFSARLLHPSEQRELLSRGYGITNLVNRATATADEVAPEEFIVGRRRLAAKVRRLQPKVVAFLAVGAYCHAFGMRRAVLGEQRERFEDARVWVLPNPSGLNANYQLGALVELFRSLKKAADA